MTTKELMNRTELDALAVKLVGDGNSPNLFFVSALAEDSENEFESRVLTITSDFRVAYYQWRKLAVNSPNRQPMLEDRLYGKMADVSRCEETGKLVSYDDTGL